MSEQNFPPPEGPAALEPNRVQVWFAGLDVTGEELAGLSRLLADDERERAARFHFDQHRNRYIVGRGILRRLLGAYTGRPPERVEIAYGSNDKPRLADKCPPDDIRFNVSHSQGVAAYAFGIGVEVGVDIEVIRPVHDCMSIAKRFFSPREFEVLRNTPADRRLDIFFNAWTRKEAYIKAMGGGLSIPLNSFDVSLEPGEPARLIQIDGSPEKAQAWSMGSFNPALNTVAAAAAEGRGREFAWYAVRPWVGPGGCAEDGGARARSGPISRRPDFSG